MALYRDHAVVLRSWKLGEADRIISMLTRDHGKVRGVAKGVRRTKSKFGARLEPLSHVAVQLYRGRGDLDTITQVSIITAFRNLRNDLDRVLAAGTMIEVVDAVVQEDEPSQRMFLLLQRGLTVLDHGPAHPDLVTSFLLKAAAIIGVAPSLESCAGCGVSGPLRRFSFSAGGSLCEGCRTPGSYNLREGLVPYMAVVAAADLHLLPEADESMSREALGVTKRFFEYHLERQLDTLAVMP